MSGELRYDGRVCVITGAGGGLGRAYALLFGSRGAKVVVNDLGAAVDGSTDPSSTPAAKVVAEIKALGGEAVPNYDSVENGDRIIKTALDNYGRVDIVINNAGILRDKSFLKMTEQDWNLVNLVHLRGSYSVTKAAWDIMRNQGFGRILMTTSAAGLYGNAGQANYSAAKLGILGLANSLAIEGKSKNVFVNTIAPIAGTRMTATIMPPELVDALKPEFVAPLVGFLCHESNPTTGGIFEVGAGWIAALRRQRTKGHVFPLSRGLLPEDIQSHWNQITDFTSPDVPESIQDSLGLLMDQINKEHPPFPEPPKSLRFDGRVVVVTGAGNGLGRTYAHMFAARGAKVVVNDLGGSIQGGDEKSAAQRPAQVVVDEIIKNGGEAVANFDSVEHGDRIIATAMKTWGRVDIVINNAGILRDKSFSKMTDMDWDLIFKVHATGSYSVSKAAWETMREQGFGRIIMTTSAAGLYGNHGQANYSAAKLAILGLANTLAIEGERRNIHVNTIAPVAGTRMTATVMPQNLVDALKTEYIAPLVLWLCHEDSSVNGNVFEVGAGWVSQVRWERTRGKLLPSNQLSPETIQKHWDEILDFSQNSVIPTGAQDSITSVISALEQSKLESSSSSSSKNNNSAGGNENVNPSQVIGYEFQPITQSYTAKDTAFYALSVGAAFENPTDDQQLSFVYENHPEFQALPTLAITFPFPVLAQLAGGIPGLQFNPMMLLHGEQDLRIIRPIPTEGTITSTARISGLYDKGKGVSVVIEASSSDQHGNQLAVNEFTLFIRGIGGYGGDRGPNPEDLSPPKNQAPSAVQVEKTLSNQALYYRLSSGDLNPLHADPSMAAMGNFPQPILHGMCTYGFAARAVLQHFCENQSARFKGIKARMTKHVFPGETLETSMWKVSPSKIIFQVRAIERNEIVLGNACVTIEPSIDDQQQQQQQQQSGGGAPSGALVSGSKPGFVSNQIFEQIAAKLPEHGAEQVKKVGGVYEFKITSGPGGETQSWTVDLKNGHGSVKPEAPNKPDCTIIISDSDCMDLFSGKLNPQQAFMQGKVKITGNMSFAMKLDVLVKSEKSKL